MTDNNVKGTVNKCTICGKPVTGADIGATCQAHKGKLRQHATSAEKAPDGWLRMSKVCDAAEKVGLSRGSIVTAAGGDAVTKPLLDPIFTVVYVGRAKYMNPEVLVKGFALLKAAKEVKAQPKAEPTTQAVEATIRAMKQAVKK